MEAPKSYEPLPLQHWVLRSLVLLDLIVLNRGWGSRLWLGYCRGICIVRRFYQFSVLMQKCTKGNPDTILLISFLMRQKTLAWCTRLLSAKDVSWHRERPILKSVNYLDCCFTLRFYSLTIDPLKWNQDLIAFASSSLHENECILRYAYWRSLA